MQEKKTGLCDRTNDAIEVVEKPAGFKASDVHDEGQDFEGVEALDNAAAKSVKTVFKNGNHHQKHVVDCTTGSKIALLQAETTDALNGGAKSDNSAVKKAENCIQ